MVTLTRGRVGRVDGAVGVVGVQVRRRGRRGLEFVAGVGVEGRTNVRLLIVHDGSLLI